MYNPFPLFNQSAIKSLVGQNKRYIVRQTLKRAFEPGIRAAFLFRAYNEDEKDTADEHMEKLKNDPNAFLYDITIKEDQQKIIAAAKQPNGFKVYYAGKTKVEWMPPKLYEDKIRKFLRSMHPSWKTKKGEGKIEVGLYERLGELFLNFKFQDETDEIPFDDIENY
jgi:hypothetical protein